jgi:hypothetical protein
MQAISTRILVVLLELTSPPNSGANIADVENGISITEVKCVTTKTAVRERFTDGIVEQVWLCL